MNKDSCRLFPVVWNLVGKQAAVEDYRQDHAVRISSFKVTVFYPIFSWAGVSHGGLSLTDLICSERVHDCRISASSGDMVKKACQEAVGIDVFRLINIVDVFFRFLSGPGIGDVGVRKNLTGSTGSREVGCEDPGGGIGGMSGIGLGED